MSVRLFVRERGLGPGEGEGPASGPVLRRKEAS